MGGGQSPPIVTGAAPSSTDHVPVDEGGLIEELVLGPESITVTRWHHGGSHPQPLVIIASELGPCDQAPSLGAGAATLFRAGYDIVTTGSPSLAIDETDRPADPRGRGARAAELLGTTIAQTPGLVDALLDEGIAAAPGRIGVVGQAAGGLQSVLRFVADTRIACAIAVAPEVDPGRHEIFGAASDRAEDRLSALAAIVRARAEDRPLRVIGHPQSSPSAAAASRFIDLVRPAYQTVPERLSYLETDHATASSSRRAVSWLLSDLPLGTTKGTHNAIGQIR